MEESNPDKKCALVIDSDLSLGLMVNTSAVLAMTLGKKIEGIIGSDIVDACGNAHIGITNTPLPILKGTKEKIREIREKLAHENIAELLVVDFSDVAQSSKNYKDYKDKLSITNTEDLNYLGIALYGNKKDVNRFTGNLPLLR